MQIHRIERPQVSYLLGASAAAVTSAVVATFLLQAASAQPPPAQPKNELIQPLVCSSVNPIPRALKDICKVTPLPQYKGYKQVSVKLVAETAPIVVGGYTVTTENYNKRYLPPVVEVKAGDTVAATLVNKLASGEPPPARTQARPSTEVGHKHGQGNPTNLHYFHGGIVTPRNAREIDIDAEKPEKRRETIFSLAWTTP